MTVFTDCDVTNNGSSHAKAAPSTKTAQPLPKVGALCAQWVRCGTPGCRCARGELHGPYYYRFWREEGRLRKRYVRLDDVLAVRREIEVQRTFDHHMRELVAAG
jgi:hypothetical protein